MTIILGPCFILASSLRASSSLRYITMSSSVYLRMFEVLTTRRYFGWLRFKLTIFRLGQVVSPNSWFGLHTLQGCLYIRAWDRANPRACTSTWKADYNKRLPARSLIYLPLSSSCKGLKILDGKSVFKCSFCKSTIYLTPELKT